MKAYTQHHDHTNDRARGADNIQVRRRTHATAPATLRDKVRPR